MFSDLHVEQSSEALKGTQIDLVITGSIGSVESVRFARSLRRLGAQVFPWLTKGASQFVTTTALEWACNQKVMTDFSGLESHLATRDGVVIAPASMNTIGAIAQGLASNPALALIASYLGQKKPVLVMPNMHDSLMQNPATQKSIKTLEDYGCTILQARTEEGKQKFPDPHILADQVAHCFNQSESQILVSFGTTRGYIDDVRYISNYSSGSLGSHITEELYRWGVKVTAIAGPCKILPQSYCKLIHIKTNEELKQALCDEAKKCQSGVFATSVLDYAPAKRVTGKIKSNQETMSLELVPTEKLIGKHDFPDGKKVGFKLEPGITTTAAKAIASDYMSKYKLSLFIVNSMSEVSEHKHTAIVFEREKTQIGEPLTVEGKRGLAQHIVKHLLT